MCDLSESNYYTKQIVFTINKAATAVNGELLALCRKGSLFWIILIESRTIKTF